MARPPARLPIEAFRDNFSDAEALVAYVKGFSNNRTRRMRAELRERVGDALNISTRDRDDLDCLESDDLFVVFKPNGSMGRDGFSDLRPLLRQAVVAACASLESFLADKVMRHTSAALNMDNVPPKLRHVTLSIGHWVDIERAYQRRSWGIRGVIDEAVRERSSTAPNQVGELLGMIGIEDWARKIDNIRGTPRGRTVEELTALTDRRNRIAHSADQSGQGRAAIEVEEVEEYLGIVLDVVNAVETLVDREWN